MKNSNLFSFIRRVLGHSPLHVADKPDFLALSEKSGNFFPPEFKSFPFREGDLLCGQRASGRYAISKVLKVDKVHLRLGDKINIQSTVFTATEPDFLLIIGSAYGEEEFDSLDAARRAALSGAWRVGYGHIPNRPSGAAEGQELIGHEPVRDDELEGYRLWRTEFDAGRAGIF